MSRTVTDARQIIKRSLLGTIANKSEYSGTADAKPANATELDNLLEAINSEVTSPLLMSESTTADRVLNIGSSVLQNPETSLKKTNATAPSFTGGTVEFPATSGGTITVSPGSNQILTISNDSFIKYLIEIDISGTNIVITAGTEAGTEAAASLPSITAGNTPIGYVVVRTVGANVQNITNEYIYQFAGIRSEGMVASFDNSTDVKNAGFDISLAANAATIALKTRAGVDPSPTDFVTSSFRSATITTGNYVSRTRTSALSLVIGSGVTAGTASGVNEKMYVYLVDNAGTIDLGVSLNGELDEEDLHDTKNITDAAENTKRNVLLSNSALSGVAIRKIGSFITNQATAGTWVSAPSQASPRTIEFEEPVELVRSLLSKKEKDFTFIDPPLITVPDTVITSIVDGSDRQALDITKSLQPTFGVNRIITDTLKRIEGEKGPNNEVVFGAANDKFDQVRFYAGQWFIESPDGDRGKHISSWVGNSGEVIEVFFYGTELYLLTAISNSSFDWRVTIDGGVESGNIGPVGYSTALAGQYKKVLQPWPIATGLSEGYHTVQIRKVDTNAWTVYGFDIINERSTVKTFPGTLYSDGEEYTLPAEYTESYNSGFDGSPVLNGKGGAVVQYLDKSGVPKKAIAQADGTALYLSSADHTNEEIEGYYNFREFGVRTSLDFTSLRTSTSHRADFLGDNTTGLMTSGGIASDVTNLPSAYEGVQIINGNVLRFSFHGTGLDLECSLVAGTPTTDMEVLIDGSSVGFIAAADQNKNNIIKIASGLSMGHHEVEIIRNASTEFINIRNFIIYIPKTPAVNGKAYSKYYLNGDYTFASNAIISPNTIFKDNKREFLFGGTGWAAPTVLSNEMSGFVVRTNTIGDFVELSFYGTGIEIGMTFSTGGPVLDVDLDGVNLGATGTVNTFGCTYSSGTSQLTLTANGKFSLSGLTYGQHTIRLDWNSTGTFWTIKNAGVISPTYIPKKDRNGSRISETVVGNSSLRSELKLLNELKSNVPEGIFSYANLANSTTAANWVSINGLEGVIDLEEDSEVKIDLNIEVDNNTVGSTNTIAIRIDGQDVLLQKTYLQYVAGYRVAIPLTGKKTLSKGKHVIQAFWTRTAGTLQLHKSQLTVMRI